MEITRRNFMAGAAAGAAALGTIGTGAALADAPAGGLVTASATAPGFGGDVAVELTVDTANGTIVEIAIEGAAETPNRGGRAIGLIQQQVAESGSAQIDTVGGATVTSTAIQDAVAAAYSEAMGATANLDVKMAPGKYTGYAKGYWQIWDLPVTVTVNETSILNIETPTDRFAHGETEVILQSVVDRMFPRIIATQSIGVDAITGATASSNAVKQAMRQALQEALVAGGSNPAAVSKFQIPPAKPEVGEPIVLDTDVLVVGMGTGGIFAMRSALETIQSLNGRGRVSVMGIDRAGKYGGKSAMTHEGCSVNPKIFMKEQYGVDEFVDVENFRRIWKDYVSSDEGEILAKEECIDLFLAESGNTIDWMYTRGFNFGDMGQPNYYHGGLTSFNMVFTSNVDAGTYEDRRGILDTYYKSFLSFIESQGGSYMLETEGYELIMDGDRVVGVKARNVVTGQEYVINCKAVIMNTGGFANNQEMQNTLLDERWRGEHRTIGTGQDTGLMIQAALDQGAGTWNANMTPVVLHVTLDHWLNRYPINFYDNYLDGRTGRTKAWTLNNIPMACGISANVCAVNKNGERFMDEARYESFGDLEHESWPCYRAGSSYYSILSDDLLKIVVEKGFCNIFKFEGYCSQGDIPADLPVPEVYEGLGYAIEEGMAWRGETLAELAEQLDIDPAVLEATIAEYNAMCEAGEDSAFGKDPMYLTKLENGPWYAVQVFPASFSTGGGLDVDDQIRVLKADHETPIEGLYAIGVDSLGVLLNPNKNYAGYGGVVQGWTWTSGRLAGINAANYIKETYGDFTYVSPALDDTFTWSTAR